MSRWTHAAIREEEQTDALRELGNVAFSHAATALSTLLGRRVDVEIPDVRIMSQAEVEEAVGETRDPIWIVSLRILGEREGVLALLLTQPDGAALVALLEGREPAREGELTPAAHVVLAEVANIMAGSALLALYRMLKVSLLHGTPTVHLRTRAEAEWSALQRLFASDIAIVVEAEFVLEGKKARGLMVISLADLPFFLEALGFPAGRG